MFPAQGLHEWGSASLPAMFRSCTTALPKTGLRPPLWNSVGLAGGNGLQGANCEPHSETKAAVVLGASAVVAVTFEGMHL
jgi:hypothetical protein